jgi:hypothetical protein
VHCGHLSCLSWGLVSFHGRFEESVARLQSNPGDGGDKFLYNVVDLLQNTTKNTTVDISRQRISNVGAGLAQAVQCLTTGWTTGRSGFDPRRGQRIFPLTSASRPALGPTQPPVQWVPGVLSPGIKAPGRDADHSPPSSAEVENE